MFPFVAAFTKRDTGCVNMTTFAASRELSCSNSAAIASMISWRYFIETFYLETAFNCGSYSAKFHLKERKESSTCKILMNASLDTNISI